LVELEGTTWLAPAWARRNNRGVMDEFRSVSARNLSRRNVLKKITIACAGSATGLAAGCASTNPVPEVPLTMSGERGTLRFEDAPALFQPGGSIKTRAPDGKLILLWRGADGRFGAAAIKCTHRGCEVALNAVAGRLDCPCHGSRYALDGTVLEGPAERPLKSYRVVIDESAGVLTLGP
jgi:Rieske Fe-S protein